MFTTFKNSLISIGTFGLVSLGSLVYARPSQAVDIDLSTWQQAGDVILNPSNAYLTNAKSSGSDDSDPTVFRENFLGNMHVSPKPYSDPYATGGSGGSLEAFLGLPNGAKLPANGSTAGAIEGSAIKGSITANAGDVFKFNYTFYSNEPLAKEPSKDYAFVTINGGTITRLVADINDATIRDTVGSFAYKSVDNSFAYTFTTTGTFDVALGIVDVQYNDVSSALSVSNPTLQTAADSSLQPVPEPMTIIGSMMAMVGGTALRRRFGKKPSNAA